jgi:hypothetical protein
MTGTRWGLFAGGLVLAIGLASCGSDVEDEPVATGGAGGSGGGSGAACTPTDPICYGNQPATSKGRECLASRDNSATADTAVQMRQTWFRSTAPKGNTIPIVYETLANRAKLPKLTECHMASGTSGYIQLTDWDRSGPPEMQKARTGYATFVNDAKAAITNGLCMAEVTYDPPERRFATPLDPALGMSLPFVAKPTTGRRVMQDFTLEQARMLATDTEGIFYYDEAARTTHSFGKLGWVIIWDNATDFIALPIHEVELRTKFNDESLNCAGAFRASAMSPTSQCTSPDPANPPWGCKNDECPPGDGPNTAVGYFLITELEQIYSKVLSSTLCVSYPTGDVSIADGWAKPEAMGGWGNNCRGALIEGTTTPRWNPAMPNGPDGVTSKTAGDPKRKDDGLPYGDWCSKTNQPSTDDCHDAYQSKSVGVGQAFPIRTGTCTTAQ